MKPKPKTYIWIRSLEGRVLVGDRWCRKAVWTVHTAYESEEAARSVAMGMLRDLPDWESKTVRVLAEGERPRPEVELL